MSTQEKPQDYFEQLRSEMLPYIPIQAKTLLEIGCGTGNFGVAMKSRQEVTVWGIEMNPKATNQAETRLDKVICGNAVEVIADVPDAKFDCIVCNDILEHLVDPADFLQKLKQKLTATGKIVISIPNVHFF
ncbi:MAG: hypothetical protein COX81_03020 [Candidatus Magasanikbacteria bacterium CG_4_10_14_0_2_um_filter_37_12]|uniref:Class I SAM-dependent methyltransferase n=1 Tax=Candidatus Magasanikbacteria bacterium CG_4_10_14_0_2_um_filter_37_12 TaxID=1974637 RepID=A0A2M7V7H4_9BACT|nr:MAG: hypothetical protein COX81_03020 [Candidatus Magasanikbacteria bacterium CG_4_10_14_0_2_um_filter_37_12]